MGFSYHNSAGIGPFRFDVSRAGVSRLVGWNRCQSGGEESETPI